MRRVLTMAGVIFLLGGSLGYAQVSLTPGMGLTSPFGTMNSNGPSGPAGIPLGATELDGGGLSPLAGGTLCSGVTTSSTGTLGLSGGMTTSGGGVSGSGTGMTTSGTGIAGSSSTFDGGEATLGSSLASSCNPAVTGTTGTSPGMAMAPSSGLGIGTIGSGNTIPLGSTEIGTPGESTTIGVPLPSISATPCPGTSAMTGTTTGMLGSTGTTSINGC